MKLKKYEGLTIDDWYKMNHHDWKDVVNEHNYLLEEVERLRSVIGDIESMIPDNHEEVSSVLSDILSECHRVLPMFNELIEGSTQTNIFDETKED